MYPGGRPPPGVADRGNHPVLLVLASDSIAPDMTRSNNDRTMKEHLATVPEAASLLGISPEAVRTRLSRGTLGKRKGTDNTTYVVITPDMTRSNDDITGDRTGESSPDSLAFDLLKDQVEFLREELRRKDTIIMTMAQRIPELEAAPEQREGHVTAPEETAKSTTPEQQEPSQRRSWWRAFFGLE